MTPLRSSQLKAAHTLYQCFVKVGNCLPHRSSHCQKKKSSYHTGFFKKQPSTKKFQHAPEAPGSPCINVANHHFSIAGATMAVFFEGSAKRCFHTTLKLGDQGCLAVLARVQVGWLFLLKNPVFFWHVDVTGYLLFQDFIFGIPQPRPTKSRHVLQLVQVPVLQDAAMKVRKKWWHEDFLKFSQDMKRLSQDSPWFSSTCCSNLQGSIGPEVPALALLPQTLKSSRDKSNRFYENGPSSRGRPW